MCCRGGLCGTGQIRSIAWLICLGPLCAPQHEVHRAFGDVTVPKS